MPMTRFNIFAAATTSLAVFLISTPALAGDPSMDASPTLADYFNGADTSGDAALDGAEFQVFVDTLADGGHADAIAVRASGEYDAAFVKADSDADGMVTYLEVSDHAQNKVKNAPMLEEMKPSEIVPEQMPPETEWEAESGALDDVDEMSPQP